MSLIGKTLHCMTGIIIFTSLLYSSSTFSVECIAQQKTQVSKTKQSSNVKKKASSKKKNTVSKNNKEKTAKKETSVDVKKKHQATQKEIKLTEEQIRENEKSIQKSVAALSKIDADIAVSNSQINDITQQLSKLDKQLSEYSHEIETNEQRIAELRAKYLGAVKKMRLKKGGNSGMAFIFSSGSFNQAYRRMRYLKQFSEWRTKQSEEIQQRVTELKYKQELLAQTRREKDRVLACEMELKKNLVAQHTEQDVIVSNLKKNGEALKAHLARKQAEANEMRNRISILIAEEQRRVEEERIKKEAEEKAKREAEEAARKARETELAANNAKKAENNQSSGNSFSKSQKSDSDKKNTKKENSGNNSIKKEKDYATARKRTPRSDNKSSSATSSQNTKANNSENGFASAKGSLPRPVLGRFQIVSPFGRHSLPDLPDVIYDNPGIDAEVQPGASAIAVYAGKVSGVYVLKGFSTVVIVNHGSYYTVYGNIASPSVKNGDTVKSGQSLGKLVSDADDGNRTIIHFEIWQGREKLNPMQWIR